MYFSRFKMKFHKTANLSRHATVAAANGKELLAKRLFAVFLEHVKNDAINQIKTNAACDVISPQDIKWVITVPAIWNDKAKQIMGEAAYEGGLASPRHSERVVIALEPEAAALYCRALHHISPLSQDSEDTTLAFEPETRYLLADFGGGTVDATVHEVQSDNRIRELHHATGGAWGGVYIDQNYVQLLERIFGEKMIEKFRSNHQRDWTDMMLTKFESAKRNIRPEGTLYLELTRPFYDFMNGEATSIKECINRFDNDDVRLVRGYLSLKYPEVKKLFEPVFSNICAHLKRLLENHPGVKFMILVGGFASSELLQTYLKTKFESSFGLRVIVPPHPSFSVMIGSVLFGHDPSVFIRKR
ncbi:heat shock 70 kDa protein 12A-like isoform X2 [Oscarella lobularis]